MPVWTRFGIGAFNLVAAVVSWLLALSFLQCLPNTHRPVDGNGWLAVVLVSIVVCSSTVGFLCSLSSKPTAKAIWRDAQLKLAWICFGMAVQFTVWSVPYLSSRAMPAVLIYICILVCLAVVSCLCAAKTRQYLR